MNNYGNWTGSSSSAYNNAPGWNGWQYQVPGQSQEQAQQQAPTTTNPSLGENKNVNYIQLNWNDILGGQQKFSGVTTTTGSSAMQYQNANNATGNSNGWTGTGFHQGGAQDDQRAAPTFRITMGNQGDQSSGQPGYYQPQSGGETGDQYPSQQMEMPQNKPSQGRPKPRRIYKSSFDPFNYTPCGKCLACEQQNKNKSNPNVQPYIVRPETKGKGQPQGQDSQKSNDAKMDEPGPQ